MTLTVLESHQSVKADFPISCENVPDKANLIEPSPPVGRYAISPASQLIYPRAKPIAALRMKKWDATMTLSLFVSNQAPIPLVPTDTNRFDYVCKNGRS